MGRGKNERIGKMREKVNIKKERRDKLKKENGDKGMREKMILSFFFLFYFQLKKSCKKFLNKKQEPDYQARFQKTLLKIQFI